MLYKKFIDAQSEIHKLLKNILITLISQTLEYFYGLNYNWPYIRTLLYNLYNTV